MEKKKTSILFIILTVLLSASVSFSQNTPAAEDKSADAGDSRAPGVEPIEANQYFQYSATKAAMYDDGVTQYANALVKYELTAIDNALADKSYYNVKVANTSSGETEYTAPFELHDEGKTTVEYYSVDKIGNKEQKKQYAIVVDNTAPLSKVKSDRPLYELDGKYYVSNNHLFTINSTDSLSGVGRIEYSTDGQNYQEYVKAFNVPEANDAILKVRGADNVCNVTDNFTFLNTAADKTEVEISGVELAMIVDNTPPVVTITPDKEIESRDGKNIVYENYRYTVTATDDSSGVAKIFYRLDKAEGWELYTKPIEFSIYGEHRIEAMAVDNVGNASIPVTLQVFVDTVPPPAETTAN
ncbi:MAG: hypothetical protein FWG13_07660 [Leptospirales bacterium]|nr:hypothetical protein [Leptospirales bacterium]